MSVNLLLSYAFHKGTDLAKVRRNLVCGRLLIDSGAFTAFTTGHKIELAEYAAFLERHRGAWDHAITLDVIGDPVRTRAQTHKLHELGLPVMPVFTRGGSLADFDAMVKDAGYVAVGGTVGLGTKPQRERVAMLQRRAQDLGGGIHALGVGSMATLRVARPFSADASSISGAFRFGTVVCFDGREVRNISITDRAKVAKYRDHLRAHGIDLAALVTSGRMPGQMDGRRQLMQAMSLAYAAADEHLKRTGTVPAPVNMSGPHGTGPHLYSSVVHGTSVAGGGSLLVNSATDVDRAIHHGPHLYHAVVGKNDNVDHVSALDSGLHDGPHLYTSLNRGGGPRGQEAETTAQVDVSLHDGPHLYSAVTGSPTNGHGLQRAMEVADLDEALHDGPHLYSSVGGGWLSDAAMLTDPQVHRPAPPPVWRVHGRDHHRWCRYRPTAEATADAPEEIRA